MRAFVFTDERLERLAGRFVWLSIDTERETNAAFLQRYPVDAWPSLFVIDPGKEQIALRWLGSATVQELEELLDDGERAVNGGAAGLEALLARADRLYGEGKPAESAHALEDLLQQAPPDWPRRPRAVESWLTVLDRQGDEAGCAKVAAAQVPTLPRVAARANSAGMGLSCALELPKEAPDRAALIERLSALCEDALADPPITMAADDRSGLFETLVDAKDEAGDDAGKKALARRWAQFLEAQAQAATTAEGRAVFDSHRVLAYLALGEGEKALPMLDASEKALPNDYNPPARLATVYLELGRLPEALAASDRALAKVYGPRRIRVLINRAQILAKLQRLDQARAALDEADAVWTKTPESQRSPRVKAAIDKQRKALAK